jgi:transcriptional regulator with GAF, ATPase, and Fis domain
MDRRTSQQDDRPFRANSRIEDLETKINEYKQREKIDHFVARLAAGLLDVTSEEIDATVNDSLQRIGEILDVDHVALAKLSFRGKLMPGTYSWYSERCGQGPVDRGRGESNPTGLAQDLVETTFPNFASYMQSEDTLVYSSLDEHPEWPDVLEHLKAAGFQAGIVIRLRLTDQHVEIFAVDTIQSGRVWPKHTVERLRSLGEVISNALNRKRAELELRKTLTELTVLKEKLERENIYLREELTVRHSNERILGNSQPIKQVLRRIEQVADTDSTVLITGETGTGKELIAREIHRLSKRGDKQLIKVDCAALPTTLIESELFGRERGAYTGALSRQGGRFEVADGATVFLDEIGELSQEIQVKLLRVLEEGQFERLGSSKTITVDVRVIAATNRDLSKALREGRFREDLYYRLNVFPISVPPLRERATDIPSLVWHFVKLLSSKMGKRVTTIPREEMEALQRHQWPGNVRELSNVIEHSMILCKGPCLMVQLPGVQESGPAGLQQLVEVERQHIIKVLRETGWRVKGRNGAAEVLNINPSTLRTRMKKLEIERPQLEPPNSSSE